jgi:HD-GYP domain-containing protein (c-di-GMP phosphodiesterase class II)
MIQKNLDEGLLLKAGAVKVLVNLNPKTAADEIRSLTRLKSWEPPKAEKTASEEGEVESTISDEEFTRLKIEDFFQDVVAITDFYVRLGANKYVKIFNRGEVTTSSQIQKYAQSGQKFVYFPMKDRAQFIRYQNEMARRAIEASASAEVIVKTIKTASDKLGEELKNSGIQPQLLEEGKKICQNMYDTAIKKPGLRDVILELEKTDPKTFSESFLVSFFSTIICKNLEWVGKKTIETLALSALLHDVGILQIDESIRHLDYDQMSPEHRATFHKHPILGAEALQKVPRMDSTVIAIVRQHHEYNDGSGYPLGLTANRILPLAKIVSLASGLTDYIKDNEVSVKEGLRGFLSERQNLLRHDSELVRNLIQGFRE